MAAGAALGLATAALLLTVVRPLRRPALGFVRTASTEARTLHTRPSRVLALWGGSAVAPVLQGSVIASVGFSLGLPLSWAEVVLALLLASIRRSRGARPGRGIGRSTWPWSSPWPRTAPPCPWPRRPSSATAS